MWAVHNSIKGWTLYGLSQYEIQLIINTMSPNEIKLTQVCSKDDGQWVYLQADTHRELFSVAGKANSGFPAMNAAAPPSDSDTDFFIIKPQKKQYARLHDRIDIELRVIIEGQSKTFESVTINLSEGGVFFKEAIPDWVSGYFIVRVFSGTTDYQVICSLVEDQKIKQRVQVVSEENDAHFLKYKSWLNSFKKAV